MNLAKKTESVEWQAHKAAEGTTKAAKATVKAAAKISWQEQADQASETATTFISVAAAVTDCEKGFATKTSSHRLVPVYTAKWNIVGMSKVPVTPLQNK